MIISLHLASLFMVEKTQSHILGVLLSKKKKIKKTIKKKH